MAKRSNTEKDIQKFVDNLRQSREDAMNQLADSERRIRDIQEALSDYESRAAIAAEAGAAGTTGEVTDSDTIEYTYKPGDTFGQVISDLGLKTDKGLWGDDGDVEYYAKQLDSQGIWPAGSRGNIPIGTTIKLRRRGAEEAPTTGATIPGADPREREDLMDALEKAEKERRSAKESVREAEKKENRAKDFAEQYRKENKKKEQEKELLLQAIRNALKNRR